MKFILLIIIALFYSGQNLIAQQIFDIKADLIGIRNDKLTFFKKTKDNQFEKFSIGLEINAEKDLVLEKRYISIVDEPKFQKQIIKTDDLLNYKPNQLKKEINNNSFVKRENKGNQGSRYDNLYVFENYNDRGLFSIEKYDLREYFDSETKHKNEKWFFNTRSFSNYFFLRINQKNIIVLFVKSNNFEIIDGFILPLKSSIVAVHSLSNTGYFSKHLDEIKNSNLDSLMLEKIDPHSKKRIPQNLYSINKKWELIDVFNNKLINHKFDTLSIQNGFIIGKIGEEIKIYNDNLNDITPENIRAVFANDSGYCQVLIGNEVRWLSLEGKISNDFEPANYEVCGFVSNYQNEIIKEGNHYFIRLMTNHIGEEKRVTKLKLFSDSQYDDIFFSNKKKQLSYDTNLNIPQERINSLIVEKDGKFGLLGFSITKKQDSINGQIMESINFNTILKREYDKIMFFNFYQPLLLKKDNLYGYKEINETTKYKTIDEFEINLARFTLPDNRKGWLDKNGSEYLDY